MTRDRLVLLLLVIVVVMGAEIIYLMIQNQKLQAMLEDPGQYLRTLQPEDNVPNIRAYDISGAEIALRYGPDQPHTLLTWFSAGCGSCRENFSFWDSLHTTRVSPSLRMIGFCACTNDEAQHLKQEFNIQYPVIPVTDQFLVETYKGNVLPQTVLIAPGGAVTKVWPGELLPSQKKEIQATLELIPTLAAKGGDQ